MATNNTAADVQNTVSYHDMNKSELAAMIEKINQVKAEDGVAPLVISSKTTKQDMISLLVEEDAMANPAYARRVMSAKVSEIRIEVPLSQLERNPLNPRMAADYVDSNYQDSIEAASGQPLHDIIATPANQVNSAVRSEKYYPISGNRTLEQLYTWCKRQGIKPDDHMVTIKVRQYEGTSQQNNRQILLELIAANGGLEFTPVDNMRVYEGLIAQGMSSKQIAAKVGVTSSMVSQIRALRYLPDPVLELVHYGYHADHYAKFDPSALTELNVPYHLDSDGNVVIESVAFTAAQAILRVLFEREPSKINKPDEWDAWDSQREQICQLLCQPHVLNKIKSLSVKDLKQYLEHIRKASPIWPDEEVQEVQADESNKTEKASDSTAEASDEVGATTAEDRPKSEPQRHAGAATDARSKIAQRRAELAAEKAQSTSIASADEKSDVPVPQKTSGEAKLDQVVSMTDRLRAKQKAEAEAQISEREHYDSVEFTDDSPYSYLMFSEQLGYDPGEFYERIADGQFVINVDPKAIYDLWANPDLLSKFSVSEPEFKNMMMVMAKLGLVRDKAQVDLVDILNQTADEPESSEEDSVDMNL